MGGREDVARDSLAYNRTLSLKYHGLMIMSPAFPISARRRGPRVARWSTVLILIVTFSSSANAQSDDTAQPGSGSQVTESPNLTYSDAVVEKADRVLFDAGMRRSGNTIQSTQSAELSRLISSLARDRRELRLQQKAFAENQGKLAELEHKIEQLRHNDGDLNLELARVAGLDVGKNNRLVALINATRTQIGQLRKQGTEYEKAMQVARGELNTAEQEYAESVFQVRKQLDDLEQSIEVKLADRHVQIALSVMQANFNVPADVDADQITRVVEARLREFEKEVFQETIALDTTGSGPLFTMVSVNRQSIRMIVDSGATLVTLPAEAAEELQVSVPDDAPILRMQLANGQQISGRRVSLASVRVGQFEAKDVDAVVLEPIDHRAQPLLGLSYLNRYKFELDSAGKTLGLLRVDESDAQDAKNR